MPAGQNTGDSPTGLTVHSAATEIEGLFSPDETIGDEENQPETAKPETATEQDEESTEPEATADEDEAAESSDDEEPSETDEEPAETAAQPRSYKVKVDGQEIEVTEDELLKGYSRQKDYTQKTQKLSEKEKAIEAEQTAVRGERQQYHTRLTQLESHLQGLGTEPDWDTLRNEDPNTFAQVHAAWQVHKDRLNTIAQERQRVEQQIARDADAQYAKHIAAETAKLVEKIPEWKDEAIAKKERGEMVEYAHSLGFTTAELNEIADHRALLVLRKAMQADKAVSEKIAAAKKAKPIIEKVKTATPGPSSSTKRTTPEVTRRVQRLAKTGSVHDAASALELMLSD